MGRTLTAPHRFSSDEGGGGNVTLGLPLYGHAWVMVLGCLPPSTECAKGKNRRGKEKKAKVLWRFQSFVKFALSYNQLLENFEKLAACWKVGIS
jgi:hypothetical protein